MSDSILFEILDGKSELVSGSRVAYYRHPSIFLHLKQERHSEKFREDGIRQGLMSESELIAEACGNGAWDDERESLIKALTWEVSKTRRAYEKITEPFLRKQNEERLNGVIKELEDLQKERNEIVQYSLEKYALVKTSFFICHENLFEDQDLTIPIAQELSPLFVAPYITKNQELSARDSILAAAYRPEIFDLFSICHENPAEILGGNVYKLSFFQKDLIVYGHYLYSKLKHNEVPDWAKVNAIKLFEWKKEDKDTEQYEGHRKLAQRKGGLDKITAEDKLT